VFIFICQKGHVMKKGLLGALSALALVSAAHATDLSPAWTTAPTSWAGFYMGVDGGMVSLDATYTGINFVNAGASAVLDKIGGSAGGYAGYNIQDRSFVYGV
jgi:opacity protein-like surface antigen